MPDIHVQQYYYSCLGTMATSLPTQDTDVVNEWKKVGSDMALICPYKDLVRIMPFMTHL